MIRTSQKLALSLLMLATCSSIAHAATYEIDPAHSDVLFKVRHLGISTVTGRFDTFSGKISYDPAAVTTSKADATIDINSINTNQKKRDDHLKSCEFFCTTKFAQMQFKTTEVKATSDNKFKITGELSLHGITKSVTLDAEYLGEAKDYSGSTKAGFTATGKLNRKDFGLAWSAVTEAGSIVVGDEVTLELQIQAKKVA
jgi:polyisoprenoid-binding protein YceI